MRLIKIALFIVMGFYLPQAQAQNSTLKYGLKAGINFSNIASGQVNTDEIPRVGGLLGVFASFEISENIYFSPELTYSNQGSVRRFDENGSNFTNRTHLNYINVPLLFQYYLNKRFSIDLGPYVGFNINAKAVSRSGGDRFFSSIDGVNTIDAGIAGSINYSITRDYFITARYSRGFTSVFDNTADAFGLQARNSVFNISLGLYL